MSETRVDLPTKDQFQQNIDSTFRMSLDDSGPYDFQLFKLDLTISNSIQESFSLLFRAPLDVPVIQDTFHTEHDVLGSFDMFLVAVKQKEENLIFEAVFNRLVV